MAKKETGVQYYEGIGRRREAVARVRLYIMNKAKDVTVLGKKILKGGIMINGVPLEEKYISLYEKQKILQPLRLTESDDRFAISVKVQGGGPHGQLEAVVHGISRALVLVDADAYKKNLRENDLLTRDPRARQRRMVGKGGKSRRKKQSPKR
jgi:small subunit ribosomal protein S9